MEVKDIIDALKLKIINAVEENSWKEIILNIYRTEGFVQFDADFIDQNKVIVPIDLPFDYSDVLLVQQLYQITTAFGEQKWNRLKMRIMLDKHFSLDFIWDQSFQDELDSFK